MNETIMQFGYPDNLIKEYDHWVILLRSPQVSVGSLILAAKGNYENFSDIPEEAYKELSIVIPEIEETLKDLFNYDKINYLALMMRDKYSHFHIFPRYCQPVQIEEKFYEDKNWPGPPNIMETLDLSKKDYNQLLQLIKENWINKDNLNK